MRTNYMQGFSASLIQGLGKVVDKLNYRLAKPVPVIVQLRNDIRKSVYNHENFSTIKNNKTAVNCLERFMADRGISCSLTIDELSPAFMKSFENWHLEKGKKLSYSAQNMRCLRAMLNRLTRHCSDLFCDVKTTNCQTEKRALTEETIAKIACAKLPEGTHLELSRDLFMACFYGMGIPLVDLLHIRREQYQNRHITYYRRKTHRKVEIVVCPELEAIINKYASVSSSFLFPILDDNGNDESMRQYKRFYHRYRRSLDKLSQQLTPFVHITSYMARHSWASIAYKNGVAVNDIAQAMGHSNTKITYAYIKDIDISHLSKANNIVTQAIFGCAG